MEASSSCSSLLSVHSGIDCYPHCSQPHHRRISPKYATPISGNRRKLLSLNRNFHYPLSPTTGASTSSSSSYFGTPVTHRGSFNSSLQHARNRKPPVISAVFERFTERAIKAVMFSQREARALGKDMVFTQHLLLGLIAENHSPDGFLGSGITIEMGREAVRRIWHGDDESNDPELGSSATSATDVPFSISVKRVFEAAMEYSRTMGYNFISPEHIAIGLFTVDDGSAGRVLKRLGANVNHLAAVAISRLQGELAKDGREPSFVPKGASKKLFPGKSVVAKSSEKARAKSALEQFCVDLTSRAGDGLIDPVIGRETEVQRVVQILCRRTKCNPILLGEAGVGKTAIAEGLAVRITEGNVPLFMLEKRIMCLDIGLLIAGAKERGELESRVTTLIKDVKKSGNIILFIDEVHTLVGSGTVGSGNKGTGLDIANLLKPSLGRGELQCIASTTMGEYRTHFETDKALARRFQPVIVHEPSQEDAVRILLGLREKYEAHHKCKYTLEALNAAVELSTRYIPDRHLPDKAIDLIDEAGSKAHMESYKRRKEREICVLAKSPDAYWQEIRTVQSMHDAVLAGKLNNDIASSGDGRLSDTSLFESSGDNEPVMVGYEEIAAVASLWSGIPVQQLTTDERMLLVGLDEQLKKRVVGQDEAVAAISRAVKRSRIGLKDPKRPIAALLFCGPTGVGKTELTKALADCYFGSMFWQCFIPFQLRRLFAIYYSLHPTKSVPFLNSDYLRGHALIAEANMLRLDMSEYMERHTVSKLIGSPPGYVGYGEGGTLTEAIRKRPFTVVLLDEIEKAHPDIFNILLQIFEDGHLTDSQGRRVSFKNALLVMTSNVGSTAIAKGRHNSIGFLLTDEKSAASYAGLKALVMEELESYFRPELLNRLDEVVVFRPLEKTQMLEILNLMLVELRGRLASFGVKLVVSETTMNLISEKGFDRGYGARPLRRAVTNIIEDPLSEAFLSGSYKPGDTALVDLDDTGNPVVTNLSSQNISLADTTPSL